MSRNESRKMKSPATISFAIFLSLSFQVNAQGMRSSASVCKIAIDAKWKTDSGKQELAKSFAGLISINAFNKKGSGPQASMVKPLKELQAAELEIDAKSPSLVCATKAASDILQGLTKKSMDQIAVVYAANYVFADKTEAADYNTVLGVLNDNSNAVDRFNLDKMADEVLVDKTSCRPAPQDKYWALALQAKANFDIARRRAVDNQIYLIYKTLTQIKKQEVRNPGDVGLIDYLRVRLNTLRGEAVNTGADLEYLKRTESFATWLEQAIRNKRTDLCIKAPTDERLGKGVKGSTGNVELHAPRST